MGERKEKGDDWRVEVLKGRERSLSSLRGGAQELDSSRIARDLDRIGIAVKLADRDWKFNTCWNDGSNEKEGEEETAKRMVGRKAN